MRVNLVSDKWCSSYGTTCLVNLAISCLLTNTSNWFTTASQFFIGATLLFFCQYIDLFFPVLGPIVSSSVSGSFPYSVLSSLVEVLGQVESSGQSNTVAFIAVVHFAHSTTSIHPTTLPACSSVPPSHFWLHCFYVAILCMRFNDIF